MLYSARRLPLYLKFVKNFDGVDFPDLLNWILSEIHFDSKSFLVS